jgi:hypothetical protein
MKKLAILFLFSLAFTGFVFAAHDPDADLVVTAKINPVFDVEATSDYAATELELLEAGAQDVKIGSLTVNTNNKYWKLKVTASDNGQLKAIDDTADGDPEYYIKYAVRLVANETVTNWTLGDVELNYGTVGDWGNVGLETAAYTARTTPGETDGLDVQIKYESASAAGANWVSSKSDGSELIYQSTVTILAYAP